MTVAAWLLLLCAQDDPPPKVEAIKPGQRGATMDYGPFLTSTVARVRYRRDADLLAQKTISIRLAPDVTYAFDTDLCRPAALWTGGFLDLAGTHLVTSKGAICTTAGGTLAWETAVGPGWARDGDFKDPRAHPSGPLLRDWARYEGLYRHGSRVVLSYTVGGVPVLELPGWHDGTFTRMFRVGPSEKPLEAVVGPGTLKAVASAGADLAKKDDRWVLRIPPRGADAVFTLALSTGEPAMPKPTDPAALTKGGPALWPEAIVLAGQRGTGEGAYVLDTLPVPEENPWKAWMRLTGVDFFSDGRAAVCTWSGDVWTVSGIDDGLEKVSWRRFAAGLYEPLGLCVRDDVLFVLGRDQITELRDLNGDGEADFYRNFNHDTHTMASYHAFLFDLHKDAEGNFYYSSDGQRVDSAVPMHGCVVKVAKDGRRSEIVATGLRAANGMSVGPGGEITCADNQGNWMPTSRLNWVKPGGFYGFMPHHGRAEAPKDHDPPLCWIPHGVDNSSGGQVWVSGGRWGPYEGGMLHTSYGTASLFHVLHEEVGGVVQGGVVKVPLEFASGIMRGRFHPKDGQLYLAGLRGWQTRGARDGALQRVRYTGKPVNGLKGVRTLADGLELTFTDPLDPAEAGNLDNYAAQMWNYVWSEKYGSPELWVSNPKKQGREPVEIAGAKVSADGRSVRLTIPGLKPVNQLLVRVRAKSAAGAPVNADLYYTIHRVPAGE